MNPIAFLLYFVLVIEYITITQIYPPFNTIILLLFSNVLMFWLCQQRRLRRACTLSVMISLLTLSVILMYLSDNSERRLKLLMKILIVFILIIINYV